MKTARAITLTVAFLAILVSVGTVWAEQGSFEYEATIGGHWLASGHGITVDADGNAYAIGKWYLDHNTLDILITKLAADGSTAWTKEIIGDSHDWATDIALDANGFVWMTGWTDSADFPITADAMDHTLTGFRDVFLTKLSPEDGTILYSTFLGGNYTDEGRSLVFNSAGDIILVGSTKSMDFPTTADAYQDHKNSDSYGFSDVFITRLTGNGKAILYSTYFGGFESDAAQFVELDSEENIIFAGTTNSSDFPLYNEIMASPNELFVAQMSADGQTLQFGTYLGGSDLDYFRGMAVDGSDSVYLTGSTRSTNLPTTPGAFQEEFVGEINGCGSPPYDPLHNCEDGFVIKLKTDDSGIVYGTYLGGTSVDMAGGIAVDSYGRAAIVGNTSSYDFPGYDGGPAAIFVSMLTADGSELGFTTTTWSGSANAGQGIAIGDDDAIYFTGAINVPADVYVAKIQGMAAPVAGVEPAVALAALRLEPNSPNPFRGVTELAYSVPGDGNAPVSLAIYDASGRLIRSLVNGSQIAGQRSVTWDGTNGSGSTVPGGVYFYQLRWNGEERTGRMLLMR